MFGIPGSETDHLFDSLARVQQQQQQFIQLSDELGLYGYPQLAELFSVGNNTIIVFYKVGKRT